MISIFFSDNKSSDGELFYLRYYSFAWSKQLHKDWNHTSSRGRWWKLFYKNKQRSFVRNHKKIHICRSQEILWGHIRQVSPHIEHEGFHNSDMVILARKLPLFILSGPRTHSSSPSVPQLLSSPWVCGTQWELHYHTGCPCLELVHPVVGIAWWGCLPHNHRKIWNN